jgi:cytochrome c peroxidase
MKPAISLLALCLWFSIGAKGGSIEFAVRHTHNGKPLSIDSLRYKTVNERELFSVTRLSYLLSEFDLQKEDGAWHQSGGYAFVDVGKRRTTFTIPDIADGNYRAIRFKLGLNPETNHSDEASYPANHPLNPGLNQLHWSWQGGFIFLALEGRYRNPSTSELSGYVYHLARNPNEVTVTLPSKISLEGHARVDVQFDIASLISAPCPISFSEHGTSTHSHKGDPITAALRDNLPGAFTVIRISGARTAVASNPLPPLYLPKKFTPFRFRTSPKFPVPELPRDNPLIEERVALGKRLFHESSLSRTNEISCSSCHLKKNAFADPRPVSLGVEGRTGTRNAMPLFNLAWKSGGFFWDGRAPTLREQALLPIKDHAEMDDTHENVVRKLQADPTYVRGFAKAFDPPEITPEKIGLAIEAFILTLTSFDSKFDRAMQGKTTLTPDEQRGFKLFFTEFEPRTGQRGADCFHCHGGALFTDYGFHNNGLEPNGDTGLERITGKPTDAAKFSTPSLRNIVLTAPYMHDGSFKTLEEVIDHYSDGVQRSNTLDPNLAKHPTDGLQLSGEDKAALIAFLKTL